MTCAVSATIFWHGTKIYYENRYTSKLFENDVIGLGRKARNIDVYVCTTMRQMVVTDGKKKTAIKLAVIIGTNAISDG